jgi:uncharacterized membrane protein YphA (DoxX/SURF4 family)
MTRFIGLVFLVAVFVLSGYNKIVDPTGPANYLAKSNFPLIVNEALKLVDIKYKLTAQDYVLLIRVTGGIFVSFSAFIVLNVGRSFFSFLLALFLAFITVSFHVTLPKPETTPVADQIQVLKNLAIIGGLLFVAGSRGSRKVAAPAVAADASGKNKKKQ